MATLSKQVLDNIAARMTEKSKKYVEQLRKDYEQLATDLYDSKTPDKVKEFCKQHREYVEMTGSLRLVGPGFNHECVSSTKRVVSNTASSYSANLNLTEKQAEKLVEAKRKWEKARDAYRTLVQETEAALLTLKTHKNIKENLPEASRYLPPPMSNALVVNFDSLKKRLEKQPEVKTELTVS
jgi:Mg2+ and Co2+ transporter CorA